MITNEFQQNFFQTLFLREWLCSFLFSYDFLHEQLFCFLLLTFIIIIIIIIIHSLELFTSALADGFSL